MKCPEAIINQHSHLHYKVPLGRGWGKGGCCPGSRATRLTGPGSGAAQRESPPRGWEGDQEAEELKEPRGLSPVVSERHQVLVPLICSAQHVTQPVAQGPAPQNQHCRQLADGAWHQTTPDPGWFGTVLFQAGPKYLLLSQNDLQESLPRLMLLAQRAF